MLVEDHAILAQGIHRLLTDLEGVAVVADVRTAEAALAWLSSEACDVLLLDITLPGHDGFWLLQQLRAKDIRVGTLVLTMHEDRGMILKAVEMGAAGYLLKSVSSPDLARAVAAVAGGSSYWHPCATDAIASQLRDRSKPDDLTPRDREILQLLSAGITNDDLARHLSVSKSTVKTQLRALYDKIGVRERTGAVLYAFKRGLAQSPQPSA
jgi:DNA-binding NarL/FixJ family response regulator